MAETRNEADTQNIYVNSALIDDGILLSQDTQVKISKMSNEVSSYEELRDALDEGREDYLIGRVVSHTDFKKHLDELRRKCNV